MTVHCLFEQSGTFKKEFQRLGFSAFDYDILDDFGETDFKVDLFDSIERCFSGEKGTIFDSIHKDDIVMAFFPCTMFQENNAMMFSGVQHQKRVLSDEEKLLFCIDRHKTLHHFYCLLCKLFMIALRGGGGG